MFLPKEQRGREADLTLQLRTEAVSVRHLSFLRLAWGCGPGTRCGALAAGLGEAEGKSGRHVEPPK
jgi:hypothetical protein